MHATVLADLAWACAKRTGLAEHGRMGGLRPDASSILQGRALYRPQERCSMQGRIHCKYSYSGELEGELTDAIEIDLLDLLSCLHEL